TIMPTYLSPGVYVEEVEAGSRPIEGVGTAVAAFVGLATKGPVNEPTLVSNWTQFAETFGDFVPTSYLAHSVYGYFLNGGGNCYVVRVGADSGNGQSGGGRKQVGGRPEALLGGYRVVAKQVGTKRVTVSVAAPEDEKAPDDRFRLVVNVDGKPAETFDGLTTKKGGDNLATKVSAESKLVTIEEVAQGSALMKPDKGETELVAPAPEPAPVTTERLGADDYVGDAAERTGFAGLEAIDEVTMLAVPDLM